MRRSREFEKQFTEPFKNIDWESDVDGSKLDIRVTGKMVYLEVNGRVVVDIGSEEEPKVGRFEVAVLVDDVLAALETKTSEDDSLYEQELDKWIKPPGKLRFFPILPGTEVAGLIVNLLEVFKFLIGTKKSDWRKALGPTSPGDYLELAKTEADWTIEERKLRVLVIQIEEALAAGKKRHEIISEIMHAERLGDKSETAVYAALEELSFVQEIEAHPKCSDRDWNGVDLTITLTPDNIYGFEKIDVQVKSSKVGIHHGRQKIMKKHGITTEAEMLSHLAKNRLVFLNGSQPAETIVRSFIGQLQLLKSAHTKVDHIAVLSQKFRVVQAK